MKLSQVGGVAKRAAKGWSDDRASSKGAALALYTLFSLAPLLLVTIAIAGLVIGKDTAQGALMGQISSYLGPQASSVIANVLHNAQQQGGGVFSLSMGALALLVGTTTVFAELKRDLDEIWHAHPAQSGVRKMVRTRLLSFAMVLGIGALLLASVAASAFLSAVGQQFFGGSALAARWIEFGVSFSVVTLLFAMIYKVLPAADIGWEDVWVGAAVTSVLFWIGKYLIGLYMSRASLASSFGAAGTLVVLILWVYYSAQVFFLGAEFTREYAGERRRPAAGHEAGSGSDEARLLRRARRLVRGDDPILARPS